MCALATGACYGTRVVAVPTGHCSSLRARPSEGEAVLERINESVFTSSLGMENGQSVWGLSLAPWVWQGVYMGGLAQANVLVQRGQAQARDFKLLAVRPLPQHHAAATPAGPGRTRPNVPRVRS